MIFSTLKKTIFLLAASLVLYSCATYQSKIDKKFRGLPILPQQNVAKNSFFLIGDAGSSYDNYETLRALESRFNQATADDYLLFLGDNAYPHGLLKEDSPAKTFAIQALEAQIATAQKFPGKVIFIPGNHDWYADGLEGLSRQEDFIGDKLKGKDNFLPEKGCAIETVEINDNTVLIILDTQWFLEDWDQHPKINTRCGQIYTREEFFLEVEDEVTDNQGKVVLIAMHHPMFTNGPHGGKLGAKSHLYPLGDKTPLPVLGTLISQVRATGGVSPQDVQHARYQDLMNRLEVIARRGEKVILASGHEHVLQLINADGLTQIVSGAGSKASQVALGENGLFASGQKGFVVLDVYENGSSQVRFFETKSAQNPVFQTQIFDQDRHLDFEASKQIPQSIKTAIYTDEETQKSNFFKTVWGDHYRQIYSQEVEAPVAMLDTLFGGLTPTRQGGGHQTKSLRLIDKQGNEYSMRSLRKSAVQYFQTVAFKDKYVLEEFEDTGAERLMMDFYTASHPYAALAVPTLAAAVNVMQAQPQLIYVPKQAALGNFNLNFGDEMYLIEKRIKEDKDSGAFEGADDIESTTDLFEKMRKDEKYKMDEAAYIRARLFDMLIGDFDRHGDQWRWAEFKQENGDRIYKPVPRDRDQAFVNFDGALLNTMRSLIGVSKQLQVYDAEMKDVKWMNNAGITLDRTLLKNTDREDWLAQAAYIQANLNDAEIEKAFRQLPTEVQDQTMLEIKEKLKGRLANLTDITSRYYDYYASLGIITGTDKDDIFDIERLPEGKTRVRVYRNKGGERADLMADRTFDKKDTKEIWLYGLDDDDIFESKGKTNRYIKVRIIGGQNNDIYRLENGKRMTVYDYKTLKSTVDSEKGANLKFKDNYDNNTFDYKRNILSSNTLLPTIGFNPDDGIAIGISNTFTVKGFERNPFTQKHTVSAKYFFAEQGFDARYEGEFANIIGRWNFVVGLRGTTDNFTQNFFGFGNETKNDDDNLGLDFNRVRNSVLSANIGLKRNYVSGLTLDIRAFLDAYEIDDTPNRFITTVFGASMPEIFERDYFVGAKANIHYENYDNKVSPTSGMNFNLETSYTNNTDDSRDFFSLKPEITFYNALSKNRQLVLKSYAKSHLIFNDGFEFYQAATLGGEDGLRGYRFQRFTGKRSLVFGGDVRYAFERMRLNFFVPLQLGIYGGYDLGRVWIKNDNSDVWHDSYGGGLWLNGADLFALRASLFGSDDGLRFAFGLQFDF
jgi:hypothetical protein